MRFLIRLLPGGTTETAFLATVKSFAKSVGAEARNAKWTSYGALEVDIFCPTEADFRVFLSVVEPVAEVEFSKNLSAATPYMDEGDLFSEARDYFNAERYWECHEVLEGIWRQKHGEEKRFLQGIILVCAAFVHHQKREDAVATGVLKRALPQLVFSSPSYGGFDAAKLRGNAERIIAEGRFSNFRV